MSATAKQKEQIKDWFIKEFWTVYGGNHIKDSRQKGSRGEALKKMIIINPDENEQKRILANMLAQLRADDKLAKTNEFVPRWPMCITYLNKRRYDDEIESRTYGDDNQIKAVDKCCHPSCENDSHGPRFRHCADHMPDCSNLDTNILRDQLRGIGLAKGKDESMHDYCMRCRSYYVDVVNSGGLDKGVSCG